MDENQVFKVGKSTVRCFVDMTFDNSTINGYKAQNSFFLLLMTIDPHKL